MPTFKDLSIAIITYKRPRELKRCLDSIKKQSHQPYKIIVIDSCLEKTNIPESRNIALKKCKTKYLAFIDDDCVLNKNWILSAYKFITSHPKIAFAVGRTRLLNKENPIAQCQFKNYQDWFNLSHPLDTKNVIFNFNKIKKLQFDTKFKIFEDVDFNQQLKENNLLGSYNPKMIVSHPEVPNLFSALKKNYIRGQFKANITRIWGNFDNYRPSIFPLNFSINFLFKVAFLLGYQKNPPRPITIVNKNDFGANSQRQEVVKNFLTRQHLYVNTIDSFFEFQKVIASRKYLLIFGWPLLKYRLLKSYYSLRHIDIYPKLLLLTMTLKGMILRRLLRQNKTYLAIIQYPEDMLAIGKNRPYLSLYDSPTIYFRELELTNFLPKKIIKKIKTAESEVFQNSDFVSFHWYSYFNLAKKFKFRIKHPLILNWGCQPQSKLATYSTLPKIIHLGKLNSYWVNPNLLSTISKLYKPDIYSYEIPDKNLYLKPINFKGFLKSESKISQYQFGLITLSTDDLRSEGFSAKYLLYLSYGLPVLCPEWRKDKLLKSATIYYNQKNLQKQIKKYSQKKLWQKKHQAAVTISQKLIWDNNLSPLIKIINSEK